MTDNKTTIRDMVESHLRSYRRFEAEAKVKVHFGALNSELCILGINGFGLELEQLQEKATQRMVDRQIQQDLIKLSAMLTKLIIDGRDL